jgi:hypothetical protein
VLEALPRSEFKGPIYRLAGPRDFSRAAEKRGLDPEEVMDLAAALGGAAYAAELLDVPFQPFDLNGVPAYSSPTRFSDGSFPVFYASMTAETSEAEVKYHRERTAMSDPARRLPVRLCVFHCELDTHKAVDLRPMKDEDAWKTLRSAATEDPFCLRLGREARGVDGVFDPEAFLAPSARCAGTTTPTFTRGVILNAVVDRIVKLTFDPTTGRITAMRPA